MELYQIRYFLAVSRTLNFTRAAEDCNVSQPALTRAIQKLEQELGAPLFRREGRRTHLTDLGRAMLPPLQQSLEAAEQAKEQAENYGRGDVAPLRIGLSESVPLELLLPLIRELTKAYPGMQLELSRGTGSSVMAQLEEGEVELALAAMDGSIWSRIDAWPLFSEDMRLCLAVNGPLALQSSVTASDLSDAVFVTRRHCESSEAIVDALRRMNVAMSEGYSADRESDFETLVSSGAGVGFAPQSIVKNAGATVVALPVEGLDIQRTVSLFAVAGRRYSPAAAGLVRLARSADWSVSVTPP
ncbi:LysR family transcriptional regulator [Hwanghaeella grinnelliae]|uniref:LysR family transcriptional regulator n=1 Tax=Hwanghaeella grinnelliae TaxID=2500179 RepID=UPI00138750AB|nr:LysR family transcriptional regulator [Hwanghaeella grinnelliae]